MKIESCLLFNPEGVNDRECEEWEHKFHRLESETSHSYSHFTGELP